MEPSYETGEVVDNYTRYRLTWPKSVTDAIIEYLKKSMYGTKQLSDDHKFDLMIDVGCGAGQSTTIFAPYFRSVVGTDVSEKQIEKAKSICTFDNVTYRIEPGEEMSVESNSVDLITGASVAHYLDLDKFTTECNRVLKPGGCVALFGYQHSDIKLDQEFLTCPDECQLESGFEIFDRIYREPRYQFTRDSDHPGRYFLDGHSDIYNRVETLQKERIDHLKFDWCITMEHLRMYEESMPISWLWKRTLKEGDGFPLHVAFEKMKDQWGISGMADEEIHLRITCSVFMLMLRKHIK